MMEVGRLSGESTPVPGIELPFPPPEVRRVGGIAIGVEDLGKKVLLAEDIGGSTGGRRELQCVVGGALGGVGSDPHGVLDPARLHHGQGHGHGLGTGLTGELEIRHMDLGAQPQGLQDHGPRRLHGVGVGLGPDIEGSHLLRIDPGPGQCPPPSRHRDGDGVLVETGDRFLLQKESPLDGRRILPPLVGNLLALDPISRNEGPISHDSWHFRLLVPAAVNESRVPAYPDRALEGPQCTNRKTAGFSPSATGVNARKVPGGRLPSSRSLPATLANPPFFNAFRGPEHPSAGPRFPFSACRRAACGKPLNASGRNWSGSPTLSSGNR